MESKRCVEVMVMAVAVAMEAMATVEVAKARKNRIEWYFVLVRRCCLLSIRNSMIYAWNEPQFAFEH